MEQRRRWLTRVAAVACLAACLVLGLGSLAAQAQDDSSEGYEVSVVKDTSGYDYDTLPDNGIPQLPESSDQSGSGQGVGSRLWGAFTSALSLDVGGFLGNLTGVVGDAAGALTKEVLGWGIGIISMWLLMAVVTGLNWVLNLLVLIMNYYPSLTPGVESAQASSGAGVVGYQFNHFHLYYGVIRSISFWLIVIFIVISAVKIITTAYSGSGSWNAKRLVPRVGMAVFGGWFGLYICQWILDLDRAMCTDIMGSMNIYETAGMKSFYHLITKFGSSAAPLAVIGGLVIVVMLCGLYIIYLIRFAAILVLALLSPLAFACYTMEETSYVTFMWFKLYVSFVFLNFLHAVVLTMFSTVYFSQMDAVSSMLLAMSMVYLLLKIPSVFLRSATQISEGGKQGAMRVVRTVKTQSERAGHAIAGAA